MQFLSMYQFTWFLLRICFSSLFLRDFWVGLRWILSPTHTLFGDCWISILISGVVWKVCFKSFLVGKLLLAQKVISRQIHCWSKSWVPWCFPFNKIICLLSVSLSAFRVQWWFGQKQYSLVSFIANSFHVGYKSIIMSLAVTQKGCALGSLH